MLMLRKHRPRYPARTLSDLSRFSAIGNCRCRLSLPIRNEYQFKAGHSPSVSLARCPEKEQCASSSSSVPDSTFLADPAAGRKTVRAMSERERKAIKPWSSVSQEGISPVSERTRAKTRTRTAAPTRPPSPRTVSNVRLDRLSNRCDLLCVINVADHDRCFHAGADLSPRSAATHGP